MRKDKVIEKELGTTSNTQRALMQDEQDRGEAELHASNTCIFCVQRTACNRSFLHRLQNGAFWAFKSLFKTVLTSVIM
ncbi:unnamed protein product [Cercopithifilaria johnstoni]|uniref:Uncharacterized protein n=1 Tax=Cercopithifilaria johnstoni TaxID=2874296 RepID=A0A8J2Q6S4_9BILA|nr:unnamed protein product [Cercopithifilaria johnstoni]